MKKQQTRGCAILVASSHEDTLQIRVGIEGCSGDTGRAFGSP
jgi:hypothetical protein